MNKKKLNNLLKKRHDLIPGAAHTYSKGDDQFPAIAPPAIVRGKGAYVWGTDGKKYLDWCMGLRSVILGHVNADVNAAITKQMRDGTNFGRPHVVEYELAERLTKLLPGVEMVKFAKNGSAVTTAAVKLARAYTGHSLVAVCAEHPFFSFDDWFIGSTACDSGVPEAIKKMTLKFQYNNIESLRTLFAQHKGEIACVIMEVITSIEPKEGFLESVQKLCKDNGALFIADEMITGFRFGVRGAVSRYKLSPDLITYGKGIANGYSLAVLGGRRDVMELGGIRGGKPRVFLLSATHGAETISLRAALATINILEKKNISQRLWKNGERLNAGLLKLVHKHELSSFVSVSGFPPSLGLGVVEASGSPSPILRTILLQEVVRRGILFQGYFAISAAHGAKEIATTLRVFDAALGVLKKVIDGGEKNYAQHLIGEPCKPVFRKFN